jgi:hypothetical protein
LDNLSEEREEKEKGEVKGGGRKRGREKEKL